MDQAQELLFGEFPRRVGTPSQHWVHNAAQFDIFVDSVNHRRNAYCTVTWTDFAEGPVSDKVLFDFDGNKAALPDDAADDERVSIMRNDPEVAAEVLGEACDEARKLARASLDDGIPVVGVFSGFGIHVHQLYQPTEDPKVPMTTCAAKYIDELDLQTADWAVVGDVERICRIPNVERVTAEIGEFNDVHDGHRTGLYTVPLNADELLNVTPGALLNLSTEPRVPDELCPENRPQMPIWEDYREKTNAGEADRPQRPVDSRTVDVEEDGLRDLLEELVQMPCMVERLLQPNPEHHVRMNSAVIMFNAGLNPQQVENIYAGLGWVDFDRQTTRKHLKSIYENGYSDMGCQTLREKRLCVRSDDPESCETFGWSGGSKEW